jgi:DNA-binding MarR family transcriptional regulator
MEEDILPTETKSSSGQRTRTVYLVARVYHALRATRIEPALKSAGITPLQYTIMTVVVSHEGLSSAELSRRFYVTPQTMGQVLAGLEERGFLRRKEDPENRRVLRVSLTAEGRKLVQRCDKQIEKIEQEVFGDPDLPEVAALRDRLFQVVAQLRTSTQAVVEAEPEPAVAKRRKRSS